MFILKDHRTPREQHYRGLEKLGRMMLNCRIWCVFLENDCVYCHSTCHVLHHILSFPAWAVWFHMFSDGLGWAGQRWRSRFSTGSELKSVRVWLLSALSRLSFCLSASQMCQSRQWLMSPPRTWLIFHLQPASQLFSELSTGPRASTHSSPPKLSTEALWFFGEPNHWCITCLCLCMNHLAFSISLPSDCLPLDVCFFIDQEEIREWRMSPDASCASMSLPLASVYGNQCFYSIHAPLFIANPGSTQIKSHLLAAEAEIRCWQSLLCCRSCICSCLVLCTDGVRAADTSAATIMQLHKPAKLHLPTLGSVFSWSQRWGKAEWICLSSAANDLKALC